MENRKHNPMIIMAVALLLLATGSFLLLLQTGIDARRTAEKHYGFGFKAASPGGAVWTADLRLGAAITRARAGAALDGLFGGAGEDEEDYSPTSKAFRDFYKENYADSGEPPSSSWGGGGGFAGLVGGGSGSGDDGGATSADNPPAAGKRPAETPERTAEAQKGAPQAGQAAAEPGRSAGTSDEPRKPSGISALGKPPPPLFPGQSLPSGGGAAKTAAKGGLDPFAGKNGKPDLNGDLENARASARSDYNSKMSGGAAATAAAGAAAASGGGAPSPSKPADASGDGKAGAAAKDAGKGDGEKQPVYGWWSRNDDEEPSAAGGTLTAAAPHLLEAVVTEKRNGRESPYLTDADGDGIPDEEELKTGAAAVKDSEKEAGKPDPEDLDKLSPERKTELKKEIHSLIKRVENKYGKMDDIEYVKCSATPDFCEKYGLTQNYITMVTAKKARLVLGVKYVDKRWRRFTLEFKTPGGAPSPMPEPEPEPEPGPDEEAYQD